MLVSMIFSIIIVLLLFTLGVSFGGVRLPAATWVELGGALVFGSMPFYALGLAIGYLAGPDSASPIVNMIHLPMSAASGLWMPLDRACAGIESGEGRTYG
jgi:ABC-2 type transport system permease protein